jgi:hypothetical protein
MFIFIVISIHWEFQTALFNQLMSRYLHEYRRIMHWRSPFFYMEAKFGPSDKGMKNEWHPSRRKVSEEQRDTHILITK